MNVKLEIDDLLNEFEEAVGVIEYRVDNFHWGTPLAVALKANGKDIKLCANYKVTVNKYLADFNHPLPLIETIFTSLQGGKHFTKLDCKDAYNQLELDDKTGLLLAWSTDIIGIPNVVVFIDDIVVTGKTDEENLNNLREDIILMKDKDHISGILECSKPRNVTEVKSFCSMIN
ncbi:hypothetical protein NQ315_011665 [Exocentrus adspersus]|uniref:Reverse transcriptase domain-containing protein n=1 Tax=Exocentrus adspersus TaxID=1586481 RepID=A0AAV8V583_9CUCU|nr:hypothetical protein NQ315_011665 [Exocentrus adspersus]